MSGCRSHGEQLGPYVLGALEPAEMEEMRRHLAACTRCAAEERALAALPTLLDSVHVDEPLATPSPELEDAVLDRFVRDRAAGPRSPARRNRRRTVFAGAAAAVLVALALGLTLTRDSEDAYGRAELASMPAGRGAEGIAEVAEVGAGTAVELRADRLPRGAYELWCVREDGRWVSGGTFQSRSDGSASANLTAAVRPGDYHVVVVTRPSTAGKRGAEVLRGRLTY